MMTIYVKGVVIPVFHQEGNILIVVDNYATGLSSSGCDRLRAPRATNPSIWPRAYGNKSKYRGSLRAHTRSLALV